MPDQLQSYWDKGITMETVFVVSLVIFTIIIAAADYPTWWGGVNLHPSARPYPEWHRLFSETFSGTVRLIGPTSTSEMWSVTYAS